MNQTGSILFKLNHTCLSPAYHKPPSYCKSLAFSSSSPATVITPNQFHWGADITCPACLRSWKAVQSFQLQPAGQPTYLFSAQSGVDTLRHSWLLAQAGNAHLLTGGFEAKSHIQPLSRTDVSITLIGKRPKELFCERCVTQTHIRYFLELFEYSS